MASPAALLPLLLLPSLLSAPPNSTSSQDPKVSTQELSPSPSTMRSMEVGELSGSEESPRAGPTPWVAEKAKDDSSTVELYLYNGDASVLTSSTCGQPFRLTSQGGVLPPDLQPLLHQAVVSLTSTANFLNLIFQASELRETSVEEDIEWYHALVRAMLEGDGPGWVRHAVLTFDADPAATQPHLVLRASRGSLQDTYLQDLTLAWEPPESTWFTSLKSKNPPLHGLSKRVLLNDLSTLDTPKWARGDSYVTNSSGLQWGDAPFLECENGHFLPGWLLTLSVPFYGLKPDLNPEFRGVIRMDVNIQGFDIDQCASGDAWFADTHQCNRTSMECEPVPRQGFRLGQYCCRCKEGYYSPPVESQDQVVAGVNGSQGCHPKVPVCLPCWPGCKQCEDGSPCWVQEDWLLRAGLLSMQGFFMVLVLVLMLKAYQYRRTRRIRASGVLLLEMILIGSLLLYFPVFILYFKPSPFRCILLRWVRLLGFAIVYGTVTLKMYRVLKVFLSRTAQRMPYMSNICVMKLLGVMVLTVSWFLCAWTAGVLQNQDRNIPLLITFTTSDGQGFRVCDLDRWDYMMAVAELLLLCWGSALYRSVKRVPSAYHEPRYMGMAVHNELLVSSVFHVLRFMRPFLHPDWMILLFFTHTHITITVTLGLLFIPKFLYMSRPLKEDVAEVYEDEVDLRRSCSFLNNSFTSACSLDPDDIRDELKKLYAQLEVQKNKTLTNNNPHLQKKRSSRLTLGRSIIRRIAEIPESLSRQCSHEDKDTSGGGGTRKWSGSFIATPESTRASMRKDGTPKRRKSHCAYEHGSERDASLMNSSLRSNVDKRSHVSEAESIDTVPLVCKSASAHNLAVDNNFLQPGSPRIQKSRSFIEKHRDHYVFSPPRATEDPSFAGTASSENPKIHRPQGSIKEQTSNALLCLSFDKAEVCPWEVEEESASKNLSNQKHVTYSLSQQEPPAPDPTSPPSLLYVCPWECLPPPLSSVGEGGQGIDSDVDSSKPKFPVSSSAPGSPRGFAKPKDFSGFSFRSATQGLLVAKGIVVGKGSHARTTSMKLTPGSATSLGRKTPQTPRRAMTTVDVKPCLVKQAAVRLPSSDSPVKSPKSSAPSHICPWESEELVMEVRKQNASENITQLQSSGVHRPSLTPNSDSYHSLHQIKASLTVPTAEICPWDVPKQAPMHQQSIADICPWEVVEEPGQLQVKNARASLCPWEEDSTQTQGSVEKRELLWVGPTPELQSCVNADVCPWDVTSQVKQDSAKLCEGVIYTNAQPRNQDTKGQGTAPETLHTDDETNQLQKHQVIIRVDLCPCDSEDAIEKDQETIQSTDLLSTATATQQASQQFSSTAKVCPRESEEASQSDVKEQPKGAVEKTTAKIHPQTEACPWDYPESTITEICPLESQGASPNLKQETVGLPSQVSMSQKEHLLKAIGCENSKENSAAETKEVETSTLKGKSVLENVGPRETNEAVKIQVTICAEVCPWETSDPVKKQEPVYTEVCPWETSETMKKQGTVCAEVCPWDNSELETEQPAKSIQKQERNRDDVCPWDASESAKQTMKQKTVGTDICPWETEKSPKPVQSQFSPQADVCPLEPEDSGKSQIQETLCPQETKSETPRKAADGIDKNDTEMKESDMVLSEDMRAQGSRVSRPLTRCDALCPWDTEGESQAAITTHENSDIFTWEETIPEEDEGDDAETAAEAFIFPPDL
ncbi:metabotropic glycine receptor [Brachyhypopomus gauderio]|uniref:metabotropic glycine receptor n=1 Tax=Brachyhypopomus gauderio TaxID=698409 RepID=UPI0040431705